MMSNAPSKIIITVGLVVAILTDLRTKDNFLPLAIAVSACVIAASIKYVFGTSTK